MKKVIPIVVLYFCIYISLHANDQELFLQANQLYNDNENAKAIDTYSHIKKKGPAVWYNMGNCAFKQEQYTDALLYWYRAQKNASYFLYTQAERNINTLKSNTFKEKEDNVLDFLYKKIEGYSIIFSLLFLQIMSLIVLYCTWIFYKKCLRVKYYRVILLLLLSLFIILMTGVHVKQVINNKLQALVTKQCSVYNGPNSNYHIVHTLVGPELITVQRICDQWYKISTKNTTGWVMKNDVCII